ncbi:hypothetical protein [Streptomyces zaomyceticus]|uniref:hypothetical protein n=1 Tax=Streptomyces zaomyceticus TaxID=68286 RepID=UPI0036D06A71
MLGDDQLPSIVGGVVMPVLRQITTCNASSTAAVERRSRHKNREIDYRVEVCERHRWLAREWGGTLTEESTSGRCGTVFDYRSFDQVVQSHSDLWLRSLAARGPEDAGGDVALALAAATDFLSAAFQESRGILAALGHATRVAEALASGALPVEEGQAQVLAALSAAESVAIADRGA